MTFVQIHCSTRDVPELIENLWTTKRIKRPNAKIIFPAIHDRITAALECAFNDMGYKHYRTFNNVFWLPPETKVTEQPLPADVYLDFLNDSQVAELDKDWPHRFTGSESMIRQWLAFFFGIGLFRRSDGKLLCSAVSNHTIGIYVLHTDAEERGKGYASIVINAMNKEILRRGSTPFGTVVVGNKPSEKVFTRLKFEVPFSCGFFFL